MRDSPANAGEFKVPASWRNCVRRPLPTRAQSYTQTHTRARTHFVRSVPGQLHLPRLIRCVLQSTASTELQPTATCIRGQLQMGFALCAVAAVLQFGVARALSTTDSGSLLANVSSHKPYKSLWGLPANVVPDHGRKISKRETSVRCALPLSFHSALIQLHTAHDPRVLLCRHTGFVVFVSPVFAAAQHRTRGVDAWPAPRIHIGQTLRAALCLAACCCCVCFSVLVRLRAEGSRCRIWWLDRVAVSFNPHTKHKNPHTPEPRSMPPLAASLTTPTQILVCVALW
jgi:hypothetical protein